MKYSDEVTDEVVEAFGSLLPQLSSSARPLDAGALAAIVASPAVTVLIARTDGRIAGSLTLAMFPIPTGLRAWIEDVVVDESARGQGIGACSRRRRCGWPGGGRADGRPDDAARPGRRQAGCMSGPGFTQRETRLYRYSFG